LYITFNLLKAVTKGFDKLSFLEVIIACICIDGVSALIMMTLSDKTALASRWYVYISGVIQTLAFVVVGVALFRLLQRHEIGGWESTQCCVRVAWWGTISSCEGLSIGTIIYGVFRIATTIHAFTLAYQHMHQYDLAKKEQETAHAEDIPDLVFSRLPTTAFSKWLELLPCALLAAFSVEYTMSKQVSDSGAISDWGQSAAIVTATAGTLHWVYVLGLMVRHAPKSRHSNGLLEQVKSCFRGTYELDYTRAKGMVLKNATPDQTAEELGLDLLASTRIGDLTGVERTIRKLRARDDKAAVWQTRGGMDALSTAANLQNVKLVDALLQAGASPELPKTKPALVVAAQNGNAEILRSMMNRPNDLPRVDRDIVLEAFSEAIKESHYDVLRACLDLASKYSDTYMLSALAVHVNDPTAIQIIFDSGNLDERYRDDRDRSLMEHAADIGSGAIVGFLLRHNYCDDNLHSASLLSNIAGHEHITRLFADSGKLPALPRNIAQGAGVSFAIQADWPVAAVTAVLTKKVPLEGRFDGKTALQAAAERGHVDTVRVLLENNAAVNAPPAADGGRTALQAAAEGGHIDTVRVLLQNNAAVNAPPAGDGGRTALQAAAERGHVELSKLLESFSGRSGSDKA
jgi:ankyrin repeat protein